MPTRNQAAFIERSVASVLAQSDGLGGPLELVIADGGSTDGTPALLERLAQVHPGVVRWRSAPDGGPADAVNQAVAMARAPIVGWLNSDDLYTPGAAARALAALQAHPDWVMVYGEGEHIDLDGRPLGRYPTLPPAEPIQRWADGCPICQPTAFFRREVFLALGGLDDALRTAFDFEFWLRLFRAHPGRVGFVPQLQAQSRLHAEGITLRMREAVAMEGLEVLHRHLGGAPAHWLMTHVDEALRAVPFDTDPATVRARIAGLLDRAAGWLVPGGADALRRSLAAHRGLQLARPDFMADVYADGWAPPALALRLRQPLTPYRRLRLSGRHAAPAKAALQLRLDDADGRPLWTGHVARRGAFDVQLSLPAGTGGKALSLTLHAEPTFVPAQVQPGSTDCRTLAFLLDAAEPR